MNLQLSLDERTKRILEFISPKKNDKILVIGTGVFPSIECFLNTIYKVKDITSIDISEKNLAHARKILPEVKFEYGDAQKKFKYKTNTFDKVIMMEVLEHLKDENITLSEIRRVLKNGGKLVLTIPKKRWYKMLFSPITIFQHEREYTPDTIWNTLLINCFYVEKTNIFIGGSYLELINLWYHLIKKHIFRKLDITSIFQNKINESYKKSQKNGSDMIIEVEKNQDITVLNINSYD